MRGEENKVKCLDISLEGEENKERETVLRWGFDLSLYIPNKILKNWPFRDS